MWTWGLTSRGLAAPPTASRWEGRCVFNLCEEHSPGPNPVGLILRKNFYGAVFAELIFQKVSDKSESIRHF